MSNLNKARIINLSFNDDNRFIYDEVFDFYDGENTLFNLENGGGKSVIIQFLMQPIVPLLKIKDRKMEGFFKSKSRFPTYIMLEWKLDNNEGYFVTGIGIKKRSVQSRSYDDENSEKIDYFTFTSGPYARENKYDIENFPLVEIKDGAMKIFDFNSVISNLKDEEKKGNYKISQHRNYTDYQKEYRDLLMQHRIYPNEWKDLILKINEQEGALNNIFDNAKTSRRLLEYWILDAIEKNLGNNTDKYIEDIENYVDEVIRVEKEIKNKKIYEDFIGKLGLLTNKINDYQNKSSKLRNVNNKLNKLYLYSNDQIDMISQDINNIIISIEELKNNLSDIEYKEKSYDYYTNKNILNELEKELELAKSKFKKSQDILNQLEKEEKLLESANLYNEIEDIKCNINNRKTKIKKIQDTNLDISKEINKVTYSLKIKYKELIDNQEIDFNKINTEIETLKNNIEDNSTMIERYNKEEIQINKKTTHNEGVIDIFNEKNDLLKEKYNIIVERNILGEPIIPIKNFIEEKMDIQKGKELEFKEIDNLIGQIENNNIDLRKMEKELNIKLNNKTSELSVIRKELEIYANEFETYKDNILKYGILEDKLFEKEYIVESLNSKIYLYKESEKVFNNTLSNIKKELENIENNNFYIDDNFIKALDESNIDFETGIDFLKNNSAFENNDLKKDVLNKIPFLPYSVIVSESDLEEIKELDLRIYTNHMIPIISRNSIINIDVNYDNNVLTFNKDIRFIMAYNSKLIDKSDMIIYKTELISERDLVLENIKNIDDSLNEINAAKNIVTSFKYSKDYYIDKNNIITDINREIDSIRDEITDISNKENNNTENIKMLNNKKNELSKSIIELNGVIEALNDFDIINSKYIKAIKDIDVYNKRLFEITNTVLNLKENNRFLLGDVGSKKEASWKLNEKIEGNKKKYTLYEDAKDDILIDKSIKILTDELEVFNKKYDNESIKELKQQIDKLKGPLDIKIERLKLLQTNESEYINIIYDFKRHKEIIKKIEKIESEQSLLNKEVKVANNNWIRQDTTVKNLFNEIEGTYDSKPMDPGLIEDIDFNKQKFDIKEKINEENSKSTTLQGEITEYNTINFSIKNNLDEFIEIDFSDIYYQNIGILKEEVSQLIKARKDLTIQVNNIKNNIKSNYKNIEIEFINKINFLNDVLIEIGKKIENETSYEFAVIYIKECMNKLQEKINSAKKAEIELDNSKEQIALVSLEHIKNVYDEIKKIDKNSKIFIHGKKRSMLKIQMDEMPVNSKEILKRHIDECSTIVRNLKKENADKNKIKTTIDSYMSTKDLLNQVSNLGHCKIKTYKIDHNPENSGYKYWEDAIVDNSGGEKFVVFFTVFVTILSYIRSNSIDEDEKVIIMDNPFGPITSYHLLQPLFEIANQYKTQLICFTDLKQHAIYECFNLIYLLKIKKELGNNKEHIKVEIGKRDIDREKIDKAVFNIKTEQLKLDIQ